MASPLRAHPEFRELYRLFLVLEPTSAESERMFSALKWILAPLRSEMGEDTVWALLRIIDAPEKKLTEEQVGRVISFFQSGKSAWFKRARAPSFVKNRKTDKMTSTSQAADVQRRPVVPFA